MASIDVSQHDTHTTLRNIVYSSTNSILRHCSLVRRLQACQLPAYSMRLTSCHTTHSHLHAIRRQPLTQPCLQQLKAVKTTHTLSQQPAPPPPSPGHAYKDSQSARLLHTGKHRTQAPAAAAAPATLCVKASNAKHASTA